MPRAPAAPSSRQLPPSFVAVSPCWSAVAVPALQPAVCLHIASVALPRPHCRQTPPQGHRNGSRAPHGRSNGFFYRLPFAKPQTLQTFQLLQKFAHLRRETAPHGRSNGFFYRRSRLPFARPQTFQTLQTLDKSAQLRREKVPQQAQHAPLPHAQRPTSQANLCCYPVQICRLPRFKLVQTLQMPRWPFATILLSFLVLSMPSSVSRQLARCSFHHALLRVQDCERLRAFKRRYTVRSGPTDCVLLGVQECRLPAFNRLKPPTAALHTVLLKL